MHEKEVKRRVSKKQAALEADDMEALRKTLNARQLRFCEEYIIDFNATAAAKRAGYTGDCINRAASIFLNRPHIKRYIEHLTEDKATKITIANPDYVIKKTIDGIDKSDKMGNMSAYFRGLELLARHFGMLKDKTEISGPDGEAIKMEQIQRTNQEMDSVISTLKSMQKKAQLKVIDGGKDVANG